MSKVSVCVPIYNAEKYIEQCVRSLFEQTLDDIEYIFVDDASSDRSISILHSVLQQYPIRQQQCKFSYHEKNLGVAVTRKEAVSMATGEYIIHCDPDDWVECGIYERLYKKMQETDADMIFCSFCYHYPDGSIKESIYDDNLSPAKMIYGFLSGSVHGALWNKLYKKEFAQANDLNLPDWINMCEDVRLSIQMLLKCKKIIGCPEVLYHYRVIQQSLSSKRNQISFQSEIDNLLFYEKILDDISYGRILDHCKRRALMECLLNNSIPAVQWHSLWKRAKFGMLTAKYPWKLKGIFYLACINYSFASWLWHKIKSTIS